MILQLNTDTGTVSLVKDNNIYQHSLQVDKLVVRLTKEKLESDVLVATFGRTDAISKQFVPDTKAISMIKQEQLDDNGNVIQGKYEYQVFIPALVANTVGTKTLSLAIKQCINDSEPLEERKYRVKTYGTYNFQVFNSARVDEEVLLTGNQAQSIITSIEGINRDQNVQNNRLTDLETDMTTTKGKVETNTSNIAKLNKEQGTQDSRLTDLESEDENIHNLIGEVTMSKGTLQQQITKNSSDIDFLNTEQDTQDQRATQLENDVGIVEQLPMKIPSAFRSSIVQALHWVTENMGDTSGAISRRKAELLASDFDKGKLIVSLQGQEIDFKAVAVELYRYVNNNKDYETVEADCFLNGENECIIIDSGKGFNGFIVLDSKPKAQNN